MLDTQHFYWLTYDKILDDWTKGYVGEKPREVSSEILSASGSKYNTGYTYAAQAPEKPIPPFEAILKKDTLINN